VGPVRTRVIQDEPYRPPPAPVEPWIHRYQLAVFVGLAYALWWAPYGIGPLVAAVVVAALAGGRAGLRDVAARLTRWRVRWYWYPVAVAVPAAAVALAGNPRWSVAGLVAALAAETGWRAYALPRLQAVRAPLPAVLTLAAIVVGGQLPLVATGALGGGGLVATVAGTVWYGWLFNRTGGSALLTVIGHAVQSLASGPGWPVWTVAAVVVVVVDRPAWRVLSRGSAAPPRRRR